MQTVFLMRGYEMNCAPRPIGDGRFAVQVEMTKKGYSREAAFRALGTFGAEDEAVKYARRFSDEWLSRYG
ncbi:hypothetical protein [Burkholderia glumae]